MKRTVHTLSALLLLPLALGACADPESPAAPTQEIAEAPPFGPRAGQGDPADGPTLVDVALAVNADTGEFDALIQLLVGTGLDAALDGRKPFTVFAPTDAAFAALGISAETEEEIASLQEALEGEEFAAFVTDVLLYHVTRGVRNSPSVLGAKQILMLNGDRIEVSREGVINGGQAAIAQPDVSASNGVIHVIDGVLLPPTD